jgi:tetratricopeptide (TPR) repeat protein
MNKKTKLIISISAIAIFLTSSFLAVKFISDRPYRNQLPEYPDFNSLSNSLKEQISFSGRKTYLNPTAENLGRLGMVYYSCTYYDKAKQCYQLAVKKNPGKWIWSYYLGYLNLEQGDSQASIGDFRLVLEKDPKNILALYYTAEACQNLGLNNNAANIYKIIASSDDRDFIQKDTLRGNDFPLQTYALFRLARILMISNSLDSAEITLKQIIENQMTFGPAYRLLGDVYNREGNKQLASQYAIRANDLYEYIPPSDMLIDNIAFIARSDDYLLKQIDDAIRSGNFKWALKLLEHSLKYNPENKYLISKAIYGYFGMGLEKMALPYLDQHIKYYSDNFNELIDLADLLKSKGFNAQAMNYFTQAKKLKPGNSRLALWLQDRGLKNEAVSLLKEQLAKDPENIKTLIDAANMMLKLGNKEEAMKYLTHVKLLSPSNRDARKLTGMIEERKGNLKKALSVYEEVLTEDPKDKNLIKYLANIYNREKMWNKAIAHFRLSLKSYPNEPFLLDGLGNLLIACPDSVLINVDEGREYAERAYINVHSTMSIKISAGANLATAYAKLGDRQKASKYVNLITDLVLKAKVSKDYIAFFDTLRRQYNISN